MKRISATALIITFAVVDLVAADPARPSFYPIQDGWYQATVQYTTSEQPVPRTFMLNVFVRADRVVAIDLGEQGSVQAGVNDAGYTYSGGQLTLQKDWSTGVVASATTAVHVVRADGVTLRFDISLRNRPKPQR